MGFFSKRCGICSNIIKKASYSWKLHGRKTLVCPECNKTLKRKSSSAAFGNDVDIPQVEKKIGCFKWLIIIFIVSIIAGILAPNNDTENEEEIETASHKTKSDNVVAEKVEELEVEEKKETVKEPKDVLKLFGLLLEELDELKTNPDFHALQSEEYIDWRKRVQALEQFRPKLSGDLLVLATIYVHSNGEETRFSKRKYEAFQKAISKSEQ